MIVPAIVLPTPGNFNSWLFAMRSPTDVGERSTLAAARRYARAEKGLAPPGSKRRANSINNAATSRFVRCAIHKRQGSLDERRGEARVSAIT